jgi:hypothetical protein
MKSKKSIKVNSFPQVHIDNELDFAAIKLAKGIEFKSYLKNGMIFSEDKKGRIIEVQILNISQIKKP